IAHQDNVVLRLANHSADLVDLVTYAQRLRADQQTNGSLRKILNYFLDDGDSRIIGIRDAEKHLEFLIILAAEACVIFVGFAVQPADRFEDADGRGKIRN